MVRWVGVVLWNTPWMEVWGGIDTVLICRTSRAGKASCVSHYIFIVKLLHVNTLMTLEDCTNVYQVKILSMESNSYATLILSLFLYGDIL
jgi:hypothetical protein